eukprot:Tamp_10733.p1 GENE.Tamp_10733~~Tamp_10733.p1  ORF type:complete len:451 (-),score=101.91 Tamp_10733:387-1739(-)
MNTKRDRSDSLAAESDWRPGDESLNDLLEMPAQYQQGSQERSGALEAMFNTVKKKLRDGPGPNSYKRDDDILDEYYNSGQGGDSIGGSLGRGLGGSLGGGLSGSLGAGSLGGMGVLSENFDTELFEGKDDAGSSSIFGMDDVGLSSSFKETMTIHEHGSEPGILSPFAAQTSHAPSAMAASKSRKPAGGGAATSAAAALAGAKDTYKDTDMGPPRAVPPSAKTAAPSAAAMIGGATAAGALTAMSASMPGIGIMDEGNERLSHKEVEQRRREKAKQYFDELRCLLPCGADSKFDKNTILQNTIAMIKQLQAELQHHKETREGPNAKSVRPGSQPSSQDYQQSFEMVRQPLCFCGLDGLVWESNQAFCQLLGYTNKSEVTGLSLLNKTASSDNEASSQHWQRLITSGMCNTAFYCQLLRKDNQTLTVNMDLNLVHKRNTPYCFLVATNPTT